MKVAYLLIGICLLESVWADSRNRLFEPLSKNLGEKAYEVYLNTSYFKMTSHLDLDGNEVETVGSEAFSKIDADAGIRYGFSQELEFLGGLRMRQNSSESDVATATNTNLESLWAGIRFSMLPKTRTDFRFALEAKYRQTVYNTTTYDPGQAPDDEIILGDAGNEITIGLHLSYDHTVNNYIYGYLAYNRPPNELGPEILYRLESYYPYSDWAFALGLRGIYSLGADAYTGLSDEKPAQATASTYLFNSINRSSFSPYLTIARAFSKWKMSFEVAQVVGGTSTDQGIEFLAGLSYRTQGITQERKKVASFKEYVVEATVTKSSPRGNFIRIDKGLAQDVEKGLKIDIFKADYFGGNVLVATGFVYEVGADWAIVKISTRYREMLIMPGFVARGY